HGAASATGRAPREPPHGERRADESDGPRRDVRDDRHVVGQFDGSPEGEQIRPAPHRAEREAREAAAGRDDAPERLLGDGERAAEDDVAGERDREREERAEPEPEREHGGGRADEQPPGPGEQPAGILVARGEADDADQAQQGVDARVDPSPRGHAALRRRAGRSASAPSVSSRSLETVDRRASAPSATRMATIRVSPPKSASMLRNSATGTRAPTTTMSTA